MAETHEYLLSDADNALQKHRLQSALNALQGAATMLKEWNLAEELTAIQDSYTMLLSYFAKGTADPMRSAMYEKFFARSCEIYEALLRSSEMQQSQSIFATTEKTLQSLLGPNHTPQSLFPLDGANYRTVFDAVLVSPQLTSADETALSEYLMSAESDEVLSCIIVSALTLNCMRFFDIAKVRILADLALTESAAVRARAMVGIVFITACRSVSLMRYPDVVTRIRLMMDVSGYAEEMEMVQQQIFLSADTKRFDKELREKLMPEVLKHLKNARAERTVDIAKINEKLMNPELNPEWDEAEQQKLTDSIKGITALHERGADVYISSFKSLKQRFPFFNTAVNWFWPFTFEHPDISPACHNNPILRIFLSHAGLCDSDKYSFCFMAGMIPSDKLNDYVKGMPQEIVSHAEAAAQLPDNALPADFRTVLRSYVQGFYRFCDMYVRRKDFVNPFKQNLFMADFEPFAELLNNETWMRRQADFVFQDKSYELAEYIYHFIPEGNLTDKEWQKIGFCRESLQNYPAAEEAYTRSLLLKPHSQWTLRRLAACQRYEEHFEEALSSLKELAEMRPEDSDLALLMADCCIRLEHYDEAFALLFKADYLSPGDVKTMRALAWCSLSTQKFEQAEKYYQKILSSEQQSLKSDYINAAHTAWLMGNIHLAAKRYRQGVNGTIPDYQFLDADRNLLLRFGLSENDLALMTDAVFNE